MILPKKHFGGDAQRRIQEEERIAGVRLQRDSAPLWRELGSFPSFFDRDKFDRLLPLCVTYLEYAQSLFHAYWDALPAGEGDEIIAGIESRIPFIVRQVEERWRTDRNQHFPNADAAVGDAGFIARRAEKVLQARLDGLLESRVADLENTLQVYVKSLDEATEMEPAALPDPEPQNGLSTAPGIKARHAVPKATPTLNGGNGTGPKPQFLKRASWLKDRLRERSWNKHDVARQRGPDHKTVQKVLDGFPVREDVLSKLVDSLSMKHGHVKVNLLDIPHD